MRILHYCHSFSNLTETFIYDYITELERQGVDNHVITHNRYNIIDRPFEKVVVVDSPQRWHPERLIRGIGVKIRKEKTEPASWPILRSRLEKAVKKINPDVIHAHFGPKGVVIGSVANELEIPFVVSFHGHDASKLLRDPFWLEQYKKMKKRCNAITCVSEYMGEHLSGIFPMDKINVVHVGKRIEDYPYRTPNKKIKNWLSVGSLTAKKGHEDTIKAFQKLIRRYPEQSLKIIGGGENRRYLQNLVNECGISGNITLFGSIPHKEVKKELLNADAFILSSKTADDGDKEGIPTVLMEAQAIGLPCVSTKHSGIPEVFPLKNQQLLAEEGNVTEIVKRIQKLIKWEVSEIEQIALRGREKIERDFNLEKEVEKIIAIYQKQK